MGIGWIWRIDKEALTWRLAERRAIMPRLAEKLLVMAAAVGGHCCASTDARDVTASSSARPVPSSASPPACYHRDARHQLPTLSADTYVYLKRVGL